jgi:hypothetical protein
MMENRNDGKIEEKKMEVKYYHEYFLSNTPL